MTSSAFEPGAIPDALAHAICDLITAEPQNTHPTWRRDRATGTTQKITRRLMRRKLMTVERTRVLLHAATLYQPVEGIEVAWRPVRLVPSA